MPSEKKDSFIGHFALTDESMRSSLQLLKDRLSNEETGQHEEIDRDMMKFHEELEQEVTRFANYVEKVNVGIEKQCRTLLDKAEGPATKCGKANVAALRDEADYQVAASLQLQQLVEQSTASLLALAETADSVLPGSSCGSALEKLNWSCMPTSGIIVALSDIYEVVRSAETQNQDRAWESPSSFERSTIKYWIQPGRMANVLLTAVQHVPLLVYGHQGRLTKSHDDLLSKKSTDRIWDELAASITSVYFDSDNMDLYRQRLRRFEGAQLLRARWYGDMPKGDKPVFLEMKTHHEEWINSKSIKERVSILESDMSTFLESTEWKTTDAQRLLLRAVPELSGEDLEMSTDLLLKMHALKNKYNLRPCVRSTYVRAAFQSSSTNQLRFTCDQRVAVVDEALAAPTAQFWCITGNIAELDDELVRRVPVPILEVKLAGSEMPECVRELERQGSIIEAPKFSKFLTGVAAFNADKIETLPYWATHPDFGHIFPTASGSCSNTSSTTRSSDAMRFRGKDGTIEKKKIFALKAATYKEKPGLIGRSSGWRCCGPNEHEVAPKRPVRVEPKSYFANERTFVQWISAALFLVTVSVLVLNISDGNVYRIRVGFFLILLSSVIVMYATVTYMRRVHLLNTGSSGGYVDKCGPIFLAFAVLAGTAVLLVFFYQESKLSWLRRGPTKLEPKDGICVRRSIAGISGFAFQPSDAHVVLERDLILIPSNDQITSVQLSNSTSGISIRATMEGGDFEAVTEFHNRIFAVSEGEPKSELVEFDWAPDGSNNLVLHQRWMIDAPNAEGIAFLEGDVSSGVDRLLVAGNLDTSNPADRAQASLYNIPPRQSNATANSDTKKLTARVLNRNLLASGLNDSKIGSLNYFEGLLYVLHDNERRIRVWDIETGSLLHSLSTPVVGGGFDQQWEGFSLERRPKVSTGNLRGSNSTDMAETELILHMTLDTPPQIWSIKVTETGKRGEIGFPDCAPSFVM